MLLEFFSHVVGIQNGQAADHLQTVAAKREDVGVRSHEHAEISVKRAQAPDRIGAIPIEMPFGVLARQARRRQEAFEMLLDSERARSRSAPAMRSRECFVKIELHYVGAHVAGLRD